MSRISNLYTWYVVEHWLYLHSIPLLPKIIKILIRILFAAVIPYQALIGKGTLLGYQGLGIVIHKDSIIGTNCTISQGVTLGGTKGKFGVPVLGNNVYVGAGANIIGPIKIGDNVTIGANAVVIIDIPKNSIAVGVPAKILHENN